MDKYLSALEQYLVEASDQFYSGQVKERAYHPAQKWPKGYKGHIVKEIDA